MVGEIVASWSFGLRMLRVCIIPLLGGCVWADIYGVSLRVAIVTLVEWFLMVRGYGLWW